jgi:hypothetical protein
VGARSNRDGASRVDRGGRRDYRRLNINSEFDLHRERCVAIGESRPASQNMLDRSNVEIWA